MNPNRQPGRRSSIELAGARDQGRDLQARQINPVSQLWRECNTPLGVIISAAEILEHYSERLSPDQRGEYLREIRGAGRRIADLIEQALEHSVGLFSPHHPLPQTANDGRQTNLLSRRRAKPPATKGRQPPKALTRGRPGHRLTVAIA